MAQFIKLASTTDLAPGEAKCVEVVGKKVALFNLEGNVGPRRHGERESEGLPDLQRVLSGWLATAGLCALTQAASHSGMPVS